MVNNKSEELGRLIKQYRVAIPLTLRELSTQSGVSLSHLGRIERGERFPSVRILRKIAKPLGFEENYLFILADLGEGVARQLDPYVARVLAEEPVEVQRTVIGILVILKSIAEAKGTT